MMVILIELWGKKSKKSKKGIIQDTIILNEVRKVE